MSNPAIEAIIRSISGNNPAPMPTPAVTKRRKRHSTKKITDYIVEPRRRQRILYKKKEDVMTKAQELATVTGAQVLVLIAPDTGHIHNYATERFQPMVSTSEGRELIQTFLNTTKDVDLFGFPKELKFEKPWSMKENKQTATGTELAEDCETEAPADEGMGKSQTEENEESESQTMLERPQAPAIARNHDLQQAMPSIPNQFAFSNQFFNPYLFPGPMNMMNFSVNNLGQLPGFYNSVKNENQGEQS